MAEMIQARRVAGRPLRKVTASRVAHVLAVKRDGKPTAEHERYLMELVGERLTGLATQHYLTAAMLEGSEREPQACDAYEFPVRWSTP